MTVHAMPPLILAVKDRTPAQGDRPSPHPAANAPPAVLLNGDPSLGSRLRELLRGRFSVHCADDIRSACNRVSGEMVACVLVDAAVHGVEAPDFLDSIRACDPRAPVILVHRSEREAGALSALRDRPYGAFLVAREGPDFPGALLRAIEEAVLVARRWEIGGPCRFEDIVGESDALKMVVGRAREMAQSQSRLLIEGESGTGKELLARVIHDQGLRGGKPFVAVNCSAISESLVEDEIFGHEKGSFTGAIDIRAGWFERADKGTLLLDEISTMTLPVQAKILRVVQDGCVCRVGGQKSFRADVRIIAATNKDLHAETAGGRFRPDLLQRFKVVTVRMPALRERIEDIPLLGDHFRRVFNWQFGKSVRGFTPEAMAALMRYSWPGNVRELQNQVEEIYGGGVGAEIDVAHLRREVVAGERGSPGAIQPPERCGSLDEARKETDRRLIREILKQSGGNRRQAAKALGISESSFYRKMRELQVDGDASRKTSP